MSKWAQKWVKFTNLVWTIADQNFYDTCFTLFHPTASATAYGQRLKFIRSQHSATAEGENCAYGLTLHWLQLSNVTWHYNQNVMAT